MDMTSGVKERGKRQLVVVEKEGQLPRVRRLLERFETMWNHGRQHNNLSHAVNGDTVFLEEWASVARSLEVPPADPQ